MQPDLRAAATGAMGGAVGTATMTAVMVAAQRAGLLGDFPPERIAATALVTAGQADRSEEEQDALAAGVHLAIGTGAGALFGLLRWRLLPAGGAIPQALAYATLIWFVGYKGWLPALGIMPPPERDRPGRPQAMVAAHLVYGATLGALAGRGTASAKGAGARDEGAEA